MKTMLWKAVGVALSVGLLSACMGPQGPHVRVATATAAELDALKDKDNVWYEFQPGDIVPVEFLFLGAVEGGDEKPAVLRAKRRFFFAMDSQGMMHISFDGKTFAGPESSKSVIAVIPRADGKGGQLGWVIYIGESGNVKAELEAAAKAGKESGEKTRAE